MHSANLRKRSALVQILRECNNRCSHCSQSAPHLSDSDLQPLIVSEFEQRLQALLDEGLERIRLTGGEPLLHPRVTEFIAHASGKGIDVSVVTNGLLLERLGPALASAGLRSAWISLYGPNAAEYARISERLPPTGSLARAIGTLRKAGVRTGLYCCLSSDAGCGDLSLVDALADAGVDHVKFLQLMEQGRALQALETAPSLRSILDGLNRFKSDHKDVRVSVSMRSGQAAWFREAGFAVPAFVGCVAGQADSWSVDMSGLVQPCCLTLGATVPLRIPTDAGSAASLAHCPALPSYPRTPAGEFVCPLTYATL